MINSSIFKLILSLTLNIIACLLYILLIPNAQSFPSSFLNLNLSFIVLFCIIFFLYATSQFFKNTVKYDLFFLIGFTIVHFQIPIMYSLGIRNFITDFAILDQYLMNFLTWFSGFCILLWMIGHLLGLLYIKNKNKRNVAKLKDNNKFVIKKTLSDIVLLVLFLGFVIIAGRPLLSGMYDGGKNWGENATYFFLLLRSFLIVRIFYFFYSLKDANKRSIYKNILDNKVLIIVTILYIFLFFIGGQRSTILELLILIVSCYTIYIKKINFVLILVGITVGGFIFTLLGMGRTGDSTESGNIVERGLNKANSSNEFILPTDELAGSNKVSYIAFDYFPDRIDFMDGKILLLDIVGVIPFGSRLLGNLSEVETTSPVLFTYLDQGKYSSYGTGSDVVSDIYINFGVSGTIVVFFLFGFCIALVQYKFSIERDFYWSIVSVTIIISAIFINRAQFLSPLKDIFYALILAKVFFRKIKIKNS